MLLVRGGVRGWRAQARWCAPVALCRRGMETHAASDLSSAAGAATANGALPRVQFDSAKKNHVSLIGRIIKLPEAFDSGNSVIARFRLAVDNLSRSKNETYTDVYTVSVSGDTARAVLDNVSTVPLPVMVDGRLAITYQRSENERFPPIRDVIVFANSVCQVDFPQSETADASSSSSERAEASQSVQRAERNRPLWQELLTGIDTGAWYDNRPNKSPSGRQPDFKRSQADGRGPGLWLDSCPEDIKNELRGKGLLEDEIRAEAAPEHSKQQQQQGAQPQAADDPPF